MPERAVDLVDELRKLATGHRRGDEVESALTEAADLISRLREEIEGWKTETGCDFPLAARRRIEMLVKGW